MVRVRDHLALSRGLWAKVAIVFPLYLLNTLLTQGYVMGVACQTMCLDIPSLDSYTDKDQTPPARNTFLKLGVIVGGSQVEVGVLWVGVQVMQWDNREVEVLLRHLG